MKSTKILVVAGLIAMAMVACKTRQDSSVKSVHIPGFSEHVEYLCKQIAPLTMNSAPVLTASVIHKNFDFGEGFKVEIKDTLIDGSALMLTSCTGSADADNPTLACSDDDQPKRPGFKKVFTLDLLGKSVVGRLESFGDFSSSAPISFSCDKAGE
jgi:hypothetical protein